MPGAARQVGDDHRHQRAEQPGADAVQRLHRDQPPGIVGQGIEHAAQRQHREAGQEQRLAAPGIGPGPGQRRHRHHHQLRRDDAGRHQRGAAVEVLIAPASARPAAASPHCQVEQRDAEREASSGRRPAGSARRRQARRRLRRAPRPGRGRSARPGSPVSRRMLPAPSPPSSQNTATGPNHSESPPAAAAEAALPAWLKASFRPVRRPKAARPARPSVSAAIAGAKTAAAMPLAACSAATRREAGEGRDQ